MYHMIHLEGVSLELFILQVIGETICAPTKFDFVVGILIILVFGFCFPLVTQLSELAIVYSCCTSASFFLLIIRLMTINT